MSGMPLEALLRPPVEYFSAAVCATTASTLALAPERFMLLPQLAYASSAALGALAWHRYAQARHVRRYQRGLRQLPLWAVSPADVPLSNRDLFMGKGFRWTSTHTQRLHDANKAENQRYLQSGPFYRAARHLERRYESRRLGAVLRAPRWAFCGVPMPNPVAPIADLGGSSAIHGVGLQEEVDVYQPLFDRVGHTFVSGTTRVGKTRLCEILVNQDIRRGDCVIVIDPKGDAELLRSMYIAAVEAGREKDFMVFHLGFPEHSCRYNGVGDYARITEVSSRIAGQLPGEGESATFRQFVWGYVNAMSRCMVELGQRPSYKRIEAAATDLQPLVVEYIETLVQRRLDAKIAIPDEDGIFKDPRRWKEVLRKLAEARDEKGTFLVRVPRAMQDRDRYAAVLAVRAKGAWDLLRGTAGHNLVSLFEYDQAYYNKLIASLLPFLAKLTSGSVAGILSPDYADASDPRPLLEWMTFFRQNGIIYIGLDALTDPDVAATVGSTMFSDIVSTLGRIYKHGYGDGMPSTGPITRNIRLHADEFSDLIREDFIPLLNKGGGTGSKEGGGFSATVYTQTLSDIVARLQNEAKAGQTLGNLNTLIMLRVKEPKTAEFLTGQLEKVTISDTLIQTGTSDVPEQGSDVKFRSSGLQRIIPKDVEMIQVGDVMKLPKGQAFVLMNGGQLWKIRLPLPMPAPQDLAIPAEVEAMATEMRRRYSSDATDAWATWTPLWRRVSGEIERIGRSMLDADTAAPVLQPGQVEMEGEDALGALQGVKEGTPSAEESDLALYMSRDVG